VALPRDAVYFGEVSLSGAVRAASLMAARLKEASKLGFASAVIPETGDADVNGTKLTLTRIGHLKSLAASALACD
jgi:DNA repair protein RadA/Sms